MKKRIAILTIAGLLMVSVASVGAATTYASCGEGANTRYAHMEAEDRYGEQMSSATWRHTGVTIVYVRDKATGQTSSKGCSISNPDISVWNQYAARSRYHEHYGTDHQI